MARRRTRSRAMSRMRIRAKPNRRAAPADSRTGKVFGREVALGTSQQLQTLTVQRVAMPSSFITNQEGQPNIGHIQTGQRVSSTIFLKGIHFWYEFKNKSSYDLELNFAIVQTKNPDVEGSSGIRFDFFRNPEGGQARVADFLNLVDANSYQPIYKHFSMNPDKFYILHRTKTLVGRTEAVTTEQDAVPPDQVIWSTNTTYKMAKNLKRIDKYIPFNKTINFETNDDVMTHPVYALWWWQATDNDSHTEIGILPVASYEGYTKVYFKDL